MTNFISVFPLSIIVYPGESLNLHVFEPRYIQLAKECLADKKPFGIPCVLDKKVEEYGTLMEIEELVTEYENGELDIRTRGKRVFRILEMIREVPGKLYSGAIVNYPENVTEREGTRISDLIISEVRRLYSLLNMENKFPAKDNLVSYEIAHFVGLTKLQEYELLSLFTETQRLEYIRRHLNNITPVITELEQVKARIQRNGHFRNLSLDDFEII